MKSLYDLAKAPGRWDNEGGSAPGTEIGPDTPLPPAEERILQYLGAAVPLLPKSNEPCLRTLLRWVPRPVDSS